MTQYINKITLGKVNTSLEDVKKLLDAPTTATITADTNPVTGTFQGIQVLSDTVFSAFTMDGLTNSLVGLTIPSGITLYGKITSYTLASGTVIAYGEN